MKLDAEKIDRAVLALLHLGLHEDNRAWKGFDWDSMNRLHEKGYISDPVGKAKSLVITDEGLRESEGFSKSSLEQHECRLSSSLQLARCGSRGHMLARRPTGLLRCGGQRAAARGGEERPSVVRVQTRARGTNSRS